MLAERQLRTFLRLGLRFADQGLTELWEEIERRPSDGSEHPFDVFDREVEGMGPHEFQWLLTAATVKDAVTLYEVYLEQAAGEVLHWHGLKRRTAESPRWKELRHFYRFLGIDLDDDDRVKQVRALRHVLTHRCGRVETEADRGIFGAVSPFVYKTAELNEQRALAAMDVLAESTLRVDALRASTRGAASECQN